MIRPYLIILAIIFLSFSTNSQSLNNEIQLYWPASLPSFFNNGNLYTLNGTNSYLFSLSSGQTQGLTSLVKACNTINADFLITPQGHFFCYPLGKTQATSFTLLQFDPDSYSIIGNYIYNSGLLTTYYQTDNYITYLSVPNHYKNFILDVFNTTQDRYLCNSSFNGEISNEGIYFIGTGTLYQSQIHQSYIEFAPCNSQTTIQNYISDNERWNNWSLITLNQSSIQLLSFKNGINSLSIPIYIDITGTIYSGSASGITGFKFNDTHIFSPFLQNGMWAIGLFNIRPNLTFNLVSQMNTMILGNYYIFESSISPVMGGPCQFYATLTSISGFSYNFDEGNYQNSFPDFSPIQLSNGSFVNLTQFGYFIQNPNQTIYFVDIPYNAYYQDSSNQDVIWTLFVPYGNVNNGYPYKNCVLLQIQIALSNISSTIFHSCPIFNGGYLSSVTFDTNNNPVAVFIQENLYMIQITGFKKILDLSGYSEVEATLNLHTDYGVFVGAKSSNFVSNNFQISSGTILNSSSIPFMTGSNSGSYIQILTGYSGQYFLLGSSTLQSSDFVIWDTMNQESVFGFGADASFVYEQKTSKGTILMNYPILGVDINPVNPLPDGSVVIGIRNKIQMIGRNGNVVSSNLTSDQIILQLNQIVQSGFWVLSQGECSSQWNYFVFGM